VNEFTAEIVNRSFNEGLRAAAEAVRLSAGNSALMELVRRDPVGGVEAMAAALEARAADA
jgi:hypothetical protein